MRLGRVVVGLLSVASVLGPELAGDVVMADSDDCIAWEYPVQVYRPEARRHSELWGLNRFASRDMCERERAREESANAEIVAYILKLAPKARIRKWNYSECRCDRTSTQGSTTYLDDERRATFIRIYHDAKWRIEEEAEDKKLSPQSQTARNFHATPRLELPPGAWPLVSAVPEDSEIRLLDPERTTLMQTTVEAISADAAPTLDHLSLIEVDFGDLDGAYIVQLGDEGFQTNPFISREIARIEQQLPAAFEIDDAVMREALVEVLQQRLQLLANLDRIIGTAAPTTALVRETSTAAGEAESLALVDKLFGPVVRAHWAPSRLEEIQFEVPTRIADDPVAILRSTEEIDLDTQRLATYLYLIRTPVLTENEELWLAGILEEGLSSQ